MRSMFYSAKPFNQPLDSWQVQNVKDMTGMFASADVFNQPRSQLGDYTLVVLIKSLASD